MRNKIYRNKKTGDLYIVEQVGLINATNAQDGQKMVRYRKFGPDACSFHSKWIPPGPRSGCEDCTEINNQPEYVREEQEFLEKFTPKGS